MFCVTFIGAGPKPHTEPLEQTIAQPRRTTETIRTGKNKWVDDLKVTVTIRLQDKLTEDPSPPVIGPPIYHNRTGQILSENKSCQRLSSVLQMVFLGPDYIILRSVLL